MCGIWLYLAKNGTFDEKSIKESSDRLKPRGPDMTYYNSIKFENFTLYFNFYRLAIMDLSMTGMQPFKLFTSTEMGIRSRTIYLMCNGEIYNYSYLVEKYFLKDKLKSHSDCEVLIHIYLRVGIEKLYEELMGSNSNNVDGEFALIIIDVTPSKLKIITARDMGGVRPLYIGTKISSVDSLENLENFDYFESLCFSSQLCAIPELDNFGKTIVNQFRPYSFSINEFKIIQNTILSKESSHVKKSIRDIPITIFDEKEALDKIRHTLIKCVEQRMHSDRPMMFMCSGGLDSSLISGIGAKYAKKYGQKIKTMSIGLEGGTDETYAKMVGKYIGSDHEHVLCTEEEFLDAAKNRVIDTVESYDITTVRASTGQLIAVEKIKEMQDELKNNYKVVMIGDYSDEITGGYNETKYAPTVADFNERIYELVENIHYFDAQRADRCIAMNGLEARTPFADHRFIQLYLSIDPNLRINRNGVEKYLLRKAFDGADIIPSEVIWRPKEAFSDGVSSLKKSWYKILQEDIEKLYNEEDIEKAKIEYVINTPYTKESLHYRKRFCKSFSDNVANVIPYFWLPKWGNVKDPSARVLDVYNTTNV